MKDTERYICEPVTTDDRSSWPFKRLFERYYCITITWWIGENLSYLPGYVWNNLPWFHFKDIEMIKSRILLKKFTFHPITFFPNKRGRSFQMREDGNNWAASNTRLNDLAKNYHQFVKLYCICYFPLSVTWHATWPVRSTKSTAKW